MNTADNSIAFDLFKSMGEYTLSYVYRGDFSIELSNKILALAENNMESINDMISRFNLDAN